MPPAALSHAPAAPVALEIFRCCSLPPLPHASCCTLATVGGGGHLQLVCCRRLPLRHFSRMPPAAPLRPPAAPSPLPSARGAGLCLGGGMTRCSARPPLPSACSRGHAPAPSHAPAYTASLLLQASSHAPACNTCSLSRCCCPAQGALDGVTRRLLAQPPFSCMLPATLLLHLQLLSLLSLAAGAESLE